MAKDSQRLEQEMIATAREKTGKDVPEWMAVIGAAGMVGWPFCFRARPRHILHDFFASLGKLSFEREFFSNREQAIKWLWEIS